MKKIAYAAQLEDERTEIIYNTEHEWHAKLEALKVEIADHLAELQVLSDPERCSANLEKINAKKEEISTKVTKVHNP